MRDPGPEKPRIGISACLLGQEVRYDGGHRRDRFLTDVLGPYVRWVAVCPEVEIGLGTPRPPIRLERRCGEVRLVAPQSGTDLTDRMRGHAARRVAELAGLGLDGYVLKRSSPSCGVEGVELFGEGGAPRREGRGVFAAELMERLPTLPVEEEGRLNDPALRESFITRVFARLRWRRLVGRGPPGRADLMAFHQEHKFLLMSRDPAGARRAGRILGEASSSETDTGLAERYIGEFTSVLARIPTREGHTNVLQHMAGFVSDGLTPDDRVELASLIHDYREGLVPLVVPLSLLRHHARRQGAAYLEGQVYLQPHPYERMLLNHV